ncbi:Flp family type IVb pilin [Paenarthrobacter sp. DKR-5]|uniref:Flp family type IVb pilin n=1 Tax=Paenarthrobacter sp. DKR-5 TaxID=2835535 RepID=UPI001BDC33FD|nr:Flp family type IVb pilin [Paenarthrobacter sp. DKR-5]MBT1001043.1 Flp family type IVb pilin [Paenarthrobacter sp. DKR-5]
MSRFLVSFQSFLNRFNRDEEGATATEYSLLVALIALGIVVGVTAFGGALNGFFSNLGTAVTNGFK